MQAIYKVEGMTCQGCADNIQSGLNNQSFVTKANVSLQESKLTIEADSGIDINSLPAHAQRKSNVIEQYWEKDPLMVLKEYGDQAAQFNKMIRTSVII